VLRIISSIILLSFFFTTAVAPAAAAINYIYDANGNMTSDGTRCFEYNDANQLKKVKTCANNQTIAEYLYDHTGKRIVKKEYENGTLKHTIYSPTDEYETKKLPDGTTQNTTYYKVNDEVVAKKNPDGSINYIHNDHLGSTSVLTNQSGQMVEKTTYEPYGEVKAGGTKSKFQYTGQEKDQETGLNYYDARYYDPHTHRFTQPDTLLPDIYDPQQLNRYAYVRNNPLKYTDPSGNFLVLGIPLVWWAIGALGAGAIWSATPQGQQSTKAAIKGVANAGTQLLSHASNIGKNIVSNFNSKPPAQNSSPQPQKSSPSNNNFPQMQNPIQKIAPLAPVVSNATEKLHGNNLKTTAQTWGYKLVDMTSGVIMKIGETTNPAARYSRQWLKANNLSMDIVKSGTKTEMRMWEHEEIGEYIFRYGGAPALNNIDRSVNVFR